MRSIYRRTSTALVLAAASLAVPVTAPAQSIWQSPHRPQGLMVELHHPEFKGEEPGTLTGVAFVGGRLTASPRVALVADVPLAFADFAGNSEVAIGSPYLGVEIGDARGAFEAGVRIPISGSNAAAEVGLLSEIVDRLGAFSPEATILTVARTWSGTAENGLVHRLRVGPRLLLPTGEVDDTELFVDYGGLIGYEGISYGVEGGITGWVWLTVDDADLGQRTVHQAGVQVYRRLARGGRIGLLFRLPLDDDTRDVTDFSVGLVAAFAMQ